MVLTFLPMLPFGSMMFRPCKCSLFAQVFPNLRCSGVASLVLWPLGSLRPLMSSRRVWWRRHRPWLSAMPCDPLPPQGLRGFLPGPGQEVPGGSVWAPCFSAPTRGWDPAFNKNWRNEWLDLMNNDESDEEWHEWWCFECDCMPSHLRQKA